jgi:hypothetical protein
MHSEVFTDQALTIEVREQGTAVEVIWKGKSTARDPGLFILPVLAKVLELANQKNKPLVLDFCNLEYMNSSTVTPLIRILDQVKKGTINLRIQYDKSLKWQALNFTALEVFHTDDKRIEIRGV